MLSFFKTRKKPVVASQAFSKKGQEYLQNLVHSIEEFESCLDREEYYFEHRPGFIARGLIAMKQRLSREYQSAIEALSHHMQDERPPNDVLLFLKNRLRQFDQRLSKNHEAVQSQHKVLHTYDESVRKITLKQQPKVAYSARGTSQSVDSVRYVTQI